MLCLSVYLFTHFLCKKQKEDVTSAVWLQTSPRCSERTKTCPEFGVGGGGSGGGDVLPSRVTEDYCRDDHSQRFYSATVQMY